MVVLLVLLVVFLDSALAGRPRFFSNSDNFREVFVGKKKRKSAGTEKFAQLQGAQKEPPIRHTQQLRVKSPMLSSVVWECLAAHGPLGRAPIQSCLAVRLAGC